jgi:transposase-like protein
VNTLSKPVADGRRRRRTHSDEFKAHVVAACQPTGVSIAAVAMANGVNANLLRRWLHEAQGQRDLPGPAARSVTPGAGASPSKFVALQLPPQPAPADIRIELRRGPTAVCVSWPTSAAAECAAWMRELLR